MKKRSLLLSVVAAFGFTTASMAQVPNYVPTNGLVGWWPFNGNANDESGNGYNGAVNGASLTSDRDGNANTAYSFDGISNYISTSNIPTFNNSNQITFSLWVKVVGNNASNSAAQYFISRGTDVGSGSHLVSIFQGANNTFYMGINGNANAIAPTVTESIPQVSWHHIVSQWDGSNVKLFIDGILVISNPYSQALGSLTSDLFFGKHAVSSFPYYTNGKLDDIGIWNRALTVCEIKDLYNAQLNSSTSIQAGTDVSICEGNDVIFNGSGGSNYTWNNGVQNGLAYTPTISQEYIVIGQDANNCYGTDTIYVELIPNTTATQTETSLDSYTWPINSQTYTQSGTYTAVIPNAAGCDSTITLDLSLDFTGINEFSEDNLFTVFPNPAQSAINIKADNKLIGDVYTIYDNTGRVVLTGKLNSKDTIIELGALSGGIYMFSVGENMKQTFKVIKE